MFFPFSGRVIPSGPLTAIPFGLSVNIGNVLLAYQGLWEGSLGRPQSISESLVWATPYIFGGLAVALAFKAGLFNIGVEGQIGVGSLASVYVGYAVTGVPYPWHLLLALLGMVNHTAQWYRPRAALSPEQIADGYVTLLLEAR